MNVNLPENDPGIGQWKSVLAAIVISSLLHGIIWSGWPTLKPRLEPEITPAQIIEVSLVASPPKAEAQAPPPQTPPLAPKPEPKKPEPKKAELKKPDKPKPRPKPLPLPESVPEHRPDEVAPPPPASVAPADGPRAQAPAKAPTAVSYAEASYKAPGLRNPPTRYPRVALERNWEGTVVLRVQVLTDGRAGEIRIERSSGHELLDEATVEQVKDWRFLPARKGDQAVVSWVVVPIEYKIKH